MIKHIVVWRLKETETPQQKLKNAQKAKEKLEEMKDNILGLLHLEVGININSTEEASDISLYSEFESENALKVYQTHPEHEKVKSFLRTIRTERRVVDYRM